MAKTKRKSRSIKSEVVSKSEKKRRAGISRTKMSKAQLVAHLVEHAVVPHTADTPMKVAAQKRMVNEFLVQLGSLMEVAVSPKGAGTFMMPGLFKITLKEKKAIKKGTLVRNPATGEMMPSPGKPASKKIKISPLIRLRKAVTGG